MIVRAAQPGEVADVEKVYHDIMDHLAQTVDYRHWHTEGHPSPDVIRGWVESGDMYVATDGTEIAGVMVLDHKTGLGYERAAWSAPVANEKALIIHVLGVAPAHQGRGVARFLVESAIRIARERGCLAVRLDVLVDNVAARALYTRCGFTDLGVHTIDYPNTDLNRFHLFEYVL